LAIPWLGYACGACEYCAPGWEVLCEHQLNTGYAIDGGHAEYVKANANFVGRVPRGGYPFEAAPLTCAGVTTYKAVKVSGTRSSDLVAVFGVGGLGHVAVQYARISGAAVAVDLFDDKLRLAEELGAGFPVNAGEQDPVEEIKKLGGADAVIATAVSPRAFEQGFGSLKRGGTLTIVACRKATRCNCRSSRRCLAASTSQALSSAPGWICRRSPGCIRWAGRG